MKSVFGTDGIRGAVGGPLINPEFVLKLGWAVGQVLGTAGGKAIIGKDTRISGYMLESSLEAGLSAAAMEVNLLGPMPTPAIAYLTRMFRAEVGIVISASHNSYLDNGMKFFDAEGRKLSNAVEQQITEKLEQPMEVVASASLGKAKRIDDAPGRYIEFCKSTFPSRLSLSGLKIVVDCAHGATYHIAPAVFSELGAEVIAINISPDGFNINDNCGSTAPAALQQRVVSEQADVGIALDGDGDRVVMVDRKGELVDGDELLFIMAKSRHAAGKLFGGVVGTVMTNYGFEQAIRTLGIEFIRAQVGDRYVMETLNEQHWVLGGEGSGHIVNLDLTTTGDGIISALQVLRVMVQQDTALADLKAEMHKVPQVLTNVPVSGAAVLSSSAVERAVQHAEATLKDTGRVLLRKSGTEPVIRVMVEGQDAALVEQLAAELAEAVRNA